jgi:hypothetical protein
MSSIRSDISEQLLERRKLTPSTLKTYVSLLSTVARKTEMSKVSDFSKTGPVLEYVATLEKPQTRKTILSALYVLTGEEAYAAEMRTQMQVVTATYKEHKVTASRALSRMTYPEMNRIHDQAMARYKRVPSEANTVDVLITGLMAGYYGVECPPRRLLDWATMKLRNANKDADNYLAPGNRFVFKGKYKTAKNDREKGVVPELVVPVPMRSVLTKWKRLNDSSDFLLVTDKGIPFTSSTLNKRVTSLYGFGIDQIRSIFISTVVAPALAQVEAANVVAERMGHSTQAQQDFYLKS